MNLIETTLMHKDTEVLKCTEQRIDVLCKDYLPFPLIDCELLPAVYLRWLYSRVNTMNRVFMSKVYTSRGIGAGEDIVIRDSNALSIADCFWVKPEGSDLTWDTLQEKRDVDMKLAHTALTGEIVENFFSEIVEGNKTSIFATKGAFPKAVVGRELWKLGFNSHLEVVAGNIAKYLGIACQSAEETIHGIIVLKLFTDEDWSLVHAADYLKSFGLTDADKLHENFYSKLNDNNKRLFGRQCLLQYVCLNTDFHGENFALMYSNENFMLGNVSPAYDFNSAFDDIDDVKMYYEWIVTMLPKFLEENPDVKSKLHILCEDVQVLEGLSETQIAQLKARVEYLLTL